MWFDILKNDKVDELRQQFSNKQKAIGYVPIEWGVGSEEEIKALASELGLEYKEYPQKRKIENPNPTGHSFANGGHFMWDAGKIEPHLEKTEFDKAKSEIQMQVKNNAEKK